MMTLMDGPAMGTYMVKSAPEYLRAVVDKRGGKDVLDLPDDKPADSEAVHVYRRVGEAFVYHLCMVPRGRSGPYVDAKYQWMPDVSGEGLRENAAWRAWCAAQRLLPAAEGEKP